MTDILSADEVTDGLAKLSGWSGEGSRIVRTVTLPSFLHAIRAVDRVAEAAESADHHPDIDIRWRTLTFVCATHSAGGVTVKDLDLARQIDEIVAAVALES